MRGNFICTLNCDFAVFVLGVAAVLLVVSGAYGRDGLTVFQHEKSAQQALPNGRSNDESQSVKRSDDVMALEQVVQQQANMMQTMQARLTALQSDVIDLRSKLQTSSKAVAFTVRFSMDPVQNVGEHGILMFDSIVYNLGDGYDPSTGTFTAPLPGIYVFFISIMGSDNQPAIRVDITQESGKVLDAAWAEGQGDLYDQGSSLVTTHLTAGERVWVKHDGGATALRGGVYTVFSGFLVQADQ